MDFRAEKVAVSVCMVLFSCMAWAGERSSRPVVAVFPVQDVSKKLDKVLVDSLSEYMAAAIAENGRFSIQAPGDMRRVLSEKKTESYKECFDEGCRIELGRELAANKILSSKIIRLADTCTVTAALYDLRTQATDMTATADGKCSPKALKNSMDHVAAKIRAWHLGSAPHKVVELKEGQLGEEVKKLGDSGGEETIVEFKPDPGGSVVIVDGALVCEKTPCSRKFSVGTHSVSIQKKRYLGRQESVVFAKGTTLTWALDPLFGILNVSSVPSGLDVLVNGEKVGTSPLKAYALDPGKYDVLVSSPCFYDKGKRILMEARQERTLSLELEPKVGGVIVDVKDSDGNDVMADLLVDGKKLGQAPGKFKVSVCAKKIQALTQEHGAAEMALDVEEGKWKQLTMRTEKRIRSASGEKTTKSAGKTMVGFMVSPTMGYGSITGIPADVSNVQDNSVTGSSVGAKGPTAGLRMDLNLGSLWSVVGRYDYLFLDHAGFAMLGAGVRYGQLWGLGNMQDDQDGFSFVPDASMVVGFSFVHGDSSSFEDDLNRKATSAIESFGFVVSVEVRGMFIVSRWFFLGISGEFGYLTSFGQGSDSSSVGGYEWAARGEVGIIL